MVPVGVHATKKPPVLRIASLWPFFSPRPQSWQILGSCASCTQLRPAPTRGCGDVRRKWQLLMSSKIGPHILGPFGRGILCAMSHTATWAPVYLSLSPERRMLQNQSSRKLFEPCLRHAKRRRVHERVWPFLTSPCPRMSSPCGCDEIRPHDSGEGRASQYVLRQHAESPL